MSDLARLILRLTTGGLLAGHGAQKLFGWFEGPGWRNTANWAESMNLRPGEVWGTLAGAGEFGGGTLMALGFLNPLGPLATIGAMSMATAKAHWGKPIWVTKGGAELPLTNMAVATSLILTGPGRLSFDSLLGTRLPRWLAVPGLVAVGVGVYTGVRGELPLPAETRARLDEVLRSARQSISQAAARLRQPRASVEVTPPMAPTAPGISSATSPTSTGTRAPTPGTPSSIDDLKAEHPQVTGTL